MTDEVLTNTLVHMWFTSVHDDLDERMCCWGEYFLSLNSRTDCLSFPVSVQKYIYEYATEHFNYEYSCPEHIAFLPTYRPHCCAKLSLSDLLSWLDNPFLPPEADLEEIIGCLKKQSGRLASGFPLDEPPAPDLTSFPVFSPNSSEFIELQSLCPNLISFSDSEDDAGGRLSAPLDSRRPITPPVPGVLHPTPTSTLTVPDVDEPPIAPPRKRSRLRSDSDCDLERHSLDFTQSRCDKRQVSSLPDSRLSGQEGVNTTNRTATAPREPHALHDPVDWSLVPGGFGGDRGPPRRNLPPDRDALREPPVAPRHVGRDYWGLLVVLLISVLLSYLPRIFAAECKLPDPWECTWQEGICHLPELPHCLPKNRYTCEDICLHTADSSLFAVKETDLTFYPASGFPEWLPQVQSPSDFAALILLGSLGNQLRFSSLNDGHLVTLKVQCENRLSYIYCKYLSPEFLLSIKYPDGSSITTGSQQYGGLSGVHHIIRPFAFGCSGSDSLSLRLSSCGKGPGYVKGNLSTTWFPTQELVHQVSIHLTNTSVTSILRSYLFEKIHHGVALCFEFNPISVALSSAYVPPNLKYIISSPRLKTPYYYHPGGSPIAYVSIFDEYRLKYFKKSINTFAPTVAYLFNDHGSTVFSTCDRLITALRYVLHHFDPKLNMKLATSFGISDADSKFNIRFPSAIPPRHWDNIQPGDSYFSALREESLDRSVIDHYAVDYDSLYHGLLANEPTVLYRERRSMNNHSDPRSEYDTEYDTFKRLYESTNGAEKLDIYNIVTDARHLRKVLTPESSFFSSDYVKSVHDLNKLFSPTNFETISDSSSVETGYLNLIRSSDPLNIGDGKANLVRELFHPFTLVDEVCQVTASTDAPKALTVLRGWSTRDILAMYAKYSGVNPKSIIEALYTNCGVPTSPTVNSVLEVDAPAPSLTEPTSPVRSLTQAAANLRVFRKMIRRKGRRLSYLISVPTLEIAYSILRDVPVHIRLLEDACTWHKYSPISLTTSRVIAKNAKHAILFTTSEYISDVDDDEQFHAVSAWSDNLCSSLALASPGSVLQKLLGCTF